MTVWSLATQPIDDNGITVTLHLTEWQAYEDMLREMALYVSEDEDIRAIDALMSRLHAETLTPQVRAAIEVYFRTSDTLSCAEVTEHDHPWTFGEVA